MSFNQDELQAPAWLNDEFFLDVMRESTNDPSIELTSECVLRPGTNQGDHYGSVMFRTTVNYRSHKLGDEKSINLIMKTKPEADGLKKSILEDNQIFAIEIDMYRNTLPKIARVLKGIGEEYKYPQFVYGALAPRTILILEDISDQGWVMGDFICTLDEMKPIVKNIAMLHAASVMLASEDSKFAVDHSHATASIFMRFGGMVKKGFDAVMMLTVLDPEFAHFGKPLESFMRNLTSFFESSFGPSTAIQNVLIHGDFHFKNLLHKDDTVGRHTDTIFLDYQISCWTTPVVDLYSMLDLISSQEVKDKHRSELIYMYHEQYSDLLKRMGFAGKISTLLELQMELLKFAVLELFHYIVFSSYRYMDETVTDIEALLKGEVDLEIVNIADFKKLMHTELTRFLHQGTLCNS
uniref:CHK domain-containing protein n=1 Tax=Anopheles dirus TaxID=7168 RepID=A0A1Y9H2D5_9DIPT